MKIGAHTMQSQKIHWENQSFDDLQIDLLVYSPSYSFDSYFDGASSADRPGFIETEPKLSLYMGKHEYKISDRNLSEAELHWLGQELSDFLDLELQIIYPIPRIPAPPAPPSYESCTACGCC